MMFDIANLNAILKEYVHKKDFYSYQEEVVGKLEKLAPWDTVRQLYSEFTKYLLTNEFDDYKKEVVKMLADKQAIIDTLLTKKEAGERELKMQDYVGQKLLSYESIKAFEEEKLELNERFAHLDKVIRDYKKKFETLDTDLSQMKGNINNRATLKSVNDI